MVVTTAYNQTSNRRKRKAAKPQIRENRRLKMKLFFFFFLRLDPIFNSKGKQVTFTANIEIIKVYISYINTVKLLTHQLRKIKKRKTLIKQHIQFLRSYSPLSIFSHTCQKSLCLSWHLVHALSSAPLMSKDC